MPLMDAIYERIVNRLLDRLSSMKNSKLPIAVENYSLINILAIAERAKTGQALSEPLGSARNFKDFHDLMFVPSLFPADDNASVDLAVTLGKSADKPFRLEVPFMVSAYGYGVSVTKAIKIALAKGATAGNTATNSGEGGYLKEERDNATRYVVQYNRAGWGNEPEQLRDCDMVEIRMGQGASAGSGYTLKADTIGEHLRAHMGLSKGQDAVMPAKFPTVNDGRDLARLVHELKSTTGGIPIALKIAAGDIEGDLNTALHAGVDVLVLDGAQGGTSYSPEITVNNFGVPTLYALMRAVRYMEEKGARDKMSLVVSGGLRDSGDVLKAIALGADAVYLGSAVLFAMLYNQLEDLDPGTSPFEMDFYSGTQVEKLNVDAAAESVGNFLRATADELKIAIRCLGKTRLGDVTRKDLVALNKEMEDITGVRRAW